MPLEEYNIRTRIDSELDNLQKSKLLMSKAKSLGIHLSEEMLKKMCRVVPPGEVKIYQKSLTLKTGPRR